MINIYRFPFWNNFIIVQADSINNLPQTFPSGLIVGSKINSSIQLNNHYTSYSYPDGGSSSHSSVSCRWTQHHLQDWTEFDAQAVHWFWSSLHCPQSAHISSQKLAGRKKPKTPLQEKSNYWLLPMRYINLYKHTQIYSIYVYILNKTYFSCSLKSSISL